MPLLFHRPIPPEGEIGLWQIREPESYFLDRMVLTETERHSLEEIKGHRRLEWLASRWLLHLMSGREVRGACLKDDYGKPYIINSLYEISISHSRELTSIIAAPRAVGVDVQKQVAKIDRIAHKFMREEENGSLKEESRLAHLHIYWGAKEALYKAYGRRQLDFKTHILIQPFDYAPDGGQFYGRIKKDNFSANYVLWYENIEDYILVYAMEDIGDQRLV